ncbi:DEAD/DEAH box helicase [Alkaliphilus transvaalensis]|uniref:DEAD/DEAH box helicase n=1 Tax=Alkaliphilus transvaalensis TaxID=114628 RepID=UPI00047AA461|nr:DEAD/DEAH box helicase [Alkaliphilus transvaalensis]
MLNIDQDLFREIGVNSTIYKRGKDYFNAGRVKGVKYDSVNNQFLGKVIGESEYKVSVELDEDYDFMDAQCSCPAFKGYRGYCKHIVAMLLSISKMKKSSNSNQDKDTYLVSKRKKLEKEKEEKEREKARLVGMQTLLHYFKDASILDHQLKNPLKLEVDCFIRMGSMFGNTGLPCHISFALKIGENKLYRVKDVKEFLNCMEEESPLTFGKLFTYNPTLHYFLEEDQLLINYLRELNNYENMILEEHYAISSCIFRGKDITPSTKGIKEILNILEGRYVNGEVNGYQYGKIPIIEGSLPCQVYLEEENGELQLKVELKATYTSLLTSGEYIYINNKIVKISKEEQDSIIPILKTMEEVKDQKILIPKTLQQHFFTDVFPKISKSEKVKVCKSITELIEKNQLTTKVYLDSLGNKIIAKVLFHYGDAIINPFLKDKMVKESQEVFVRQIEQEEKVIKFFENLEFKVKNTEVYLEDEEQVYRLVTSELNQLKGLADIYYSDSFNKIKIREAITWMGGIRLREDDLLEFTFEINDISNKEIKEVLAALETRKKYYRLKDGTILSLENKELHKFRDTIRQLALQDDEIEAGKIQLPKYRGILIDDLIDGNQEIKRDETFSQYIYSIKRAETTNFQLPQRIGELMRGYQKRGFNWIKTFSTLGLGGILADDMGLGKTLQMISAILSDKEEGVETPSLVVVPSSLLRNWYEEIEKFAPEVKTLVIYGTPTERDNMIKSIEHYDLIITSYPLIQKDVEKYSDITFNYFIIDEAQHIKNPQSKNAKSVKEIKAKSRFALTGTPIENTLTELWSIFDFILPKYLGSYSSFREKFETPIIKDQKESAYRELTKHVKPFILRRMKSEVLEELPPKIEQIIYADLTKEQKKIYLATLDKIRGEINEEMKYNGFQRSHIKILAGLTRLRQICCHPALYIENYYGESGKFSLLVEMVKERIESGHRILLFSQFTSMLKIIGDTLKDEGIRYQYLDGSTDVKDRGEIIRDFNEGEGEVFLISLKTGGTGLNLTSADIVIHFDPWWNPAVEEQATDRAYRIGQEKAVHVIKLITKGTIEEKITALQEKKKLLIDAVIQPGETLITKLTEEEIRDIFEIK